MKRKKDKENKRGTEEAAASEKNTNTDEDGIINIVEMEVTESDKEKKEKENKRGTEENDWNSKDGGKGGEAKTVRKGPDGNEAGTDKAHEDESGENTGISRLKENKKIPEGAEEASVKNTNTEGDGIIDIVEMEVTEPGEEKEENERKRGIEEND